MYQNKTFSVPCSPFPVPSIRVGIIGLGRIASLLQDDSLREKPCTHSGAIAANPECALVCGCDTDAERRRLFGERWGVDVYADAEVMLRTHKCALLIIATHPDSHLHYCKLAHHHHIPVVICEKPLANTLKDAKKIAALTRCGELKIIINHERRYSADYIKAKSVLDAGTLGALCSVKATLAMGRSRRLVDVLWHDGTHLVDAIQFLSGGTLKHKIHFGAPLKQNTGTAFFCAAILRPPQKNIACVIEIGAESDLLVFEIDMMLTRGRIRIGNGIFEIWQSAPCTYAEGFRSLIKIEDGWQGKTAYFSNMLSDAVACFRSESPPPQSSAEDALAVIRYLESVGGSGE
ncbi:MAG: Gfo/Idh/MocA family oxidoreductase [Spirochaetaceae bacterium]|jgi:predicted dehydrogenase|nr:Gfo/Idh/MocA family oxidoreductase [Spirochaetaceae bacterium]